jgi:hypothetical protein
MRIDIGIYSQCNWRACSFCTRDAIDVVQFRFTFHVEAANALLERILDFITRFANPRKSALGGVATNGEDAIKFAAGHDVETCARIGE